MTSSETLQMEKSERPKHGRSLYFGRYEFGCQAFTYYFGGSGGGVLLVGAGLLDGVLGGAGALGAVGAGTGPLEGIGLMAGSFGFG